MLISPARWTDRNDAFAMAEYKRRKGLRTLLALCFSESFERFHYWSSFSTGMDGVLFEFARAPLLEAFARDSSLKVSTVEYSNIDTLEKNPPPIEMLPFIKRVQYDSECEFRVIHASAAESRDTYAVPIDLTYIEKIRLSPWLPVVLYKQVEATLRAIPDCRNLVIERSEMLENERWKAALRRSN